MEKRVSWGFLVAVGILTVRAEAQFDAAAGGSAASGGAVYVDDDDYRCQTNEHCYEGEVCLGGECRVSPDIDAWNAARAAAPMGPESAPGGPAAAAVPTGVEPVPVTPDCSADTDCDVYSACVAGSCEWREDGRFRCNPNGTCDGGWTCSNGLCQPGPSCESTAECVGRRRCMNRGEFGRCCVNPFFVGGQLTTTAGVAGKGRNGPLGVEARAVFGKLYKGRVGLAVAGESVGVVGDAGIEPERRVAQVGDAVVLLRPLIVPLGIELYRGTYGMFSAAYSEADVGIAIARGNLRAYLAPVGFQMRWATLYDENDGPMGLNYRMTVGVGGNL